MKIWVPLVAALCLIAFLCPLPVASWEREMHYSMGLAGEKRLLDLTSKPAEEIGYLPSAQSAEEGGKEEGASCDESVLLFRPADRSEDLAKRIAEKITEEETDYKAFAFSETPISLLTPLTEEELCFVISEIIASSDIPLPVCGEAEEILLKHKGEELYAFARIELSLSCLPDEDRIEPFPERIVLLLSMVFHIENSQISVYYDKVSVSAEEVDLPEALLIFSFEAICGKRDYKRVLGDAVKKVFVNAGIYS